MDSSPPLRAPRSDRDKIKICAPIISTTGHLSFIIKCLRSLINHATFQLFSQLRPCIGVSCSRTAGMGDETASYVLIELVEQPVHLNSFLAFKSLHINRPSDLSNARATTLTPVPFSHSTTLEAPSELAPKLNYCFILFKLCILCTVAQISHARTGSGWSTINQRILR